MANRVDIEKLNSLIASGRKIFVKFSAEWCGQCKMAAILIEKVKQDYPEVEVVELDVDDNGLWDNENFNISVVPTYVGYNNKQRVFNQPEYQVEEDMRKLFDQLK